MSISSPSALSKACSGGARHHLFRVESGEIILDLPEAVDSSGTRIQVIAVGGPGAEALVAPRAEFLSVDPIDRLDHAARQIDRRSKPELGYARGAGR